MAKSLIYNIPIMYYYRTTLYAANCILYPEYIPTHTLIVKSQDPKLLIMQRSSTMLQHRRAMFRKKPKETYTRSVHNLQSSISPPRVAPTPQASPLHPYCPSSNLSTARPKSHLDFCLYPPPASAHHYTSAVYPGVRQFSPPRPRMLD
jgi:hypothetical protein